MRRDLCAEALRLGTMLAELMPDEPEVLGLLALIELQASRAAARTDAAGHLVLLADQDRARRDRGLIARGLTHLDRADGITRAAAPSPLDSPGPRDARASIPTAGPYQLQAAIAGCHARALSWEATDWRRIVAHYDALAAIAPIDTSALRQYHHLPAARADFLRRLGRWAEAAREYRLALDLADNAQEKSFLAARLAQREGTSISDLVRRLLAPQGASA